MIRPILTIAIPTFNRSAYLDICLSQIYKQITRIPDNIEVIVSDNASTDDTSKVVNKYIQAGFRILYLRNQTNIGADGNVEKCFRHATGKYFWCFGDDDILLDNKLELICSILRASEYGMIYCNGYWFSKDFSLEAPFNKIEAGYTIFANHRDYFQKVNYWITFLTGCIINKDNIKVNSVEYIGTSLNHINWNISALFSTNNNVFIDEYILACKSGNTGGYKLATVFAKNYHRILKDFIARGYPRYILSITLNWLFERFFPMFIPTMINADNKFRKENHFWQIYKIGWTYKSYWKFVFPVYIKTYVKNLLMRKSYTTR